MANPRKETFKPTIMTQKQQAIYDARTLGGGKMLTLGLQHMFAMFGATVLVPVITGLSMSATLGPGVPRLVLRFPGRLRSRRRHG